MKQELKESPPIEANIHLLAARVSTKGSNAETTTNPLGEEQVDDVMSTMGLYVEGDHSTHQVALGKIYEGGTTIHNALHTFIAWPTNLVKLVSHEDSQIHPKKLVKAIQRSNVIVADDPLHDLIKNMCDIYDRPVELLWYGPKFGISNVETSFFLTYPDVNEIILGDKCLNIYILQLWMITRLGHGLVYGFLEPQSIHNAKDRHIECQHYIQTWVKESQQEFYLGAYLNQPIGSLLFYSHVQSGGYKCGYYVKHWMWNIVSKVLKNDWSMWFGDGTPLDIETITTIHKKWAAYFRSKASN
ncbi:hypothetical protein GmHk_08G023481 [Glycine max]|nr:hypothetical protein GmHk_08G023481 [Glycine max]